MPVKPYKKETSTSFTIGVFPTIELLQNRPDSVIRVLVHPKGERSAGIKGIISLCEKAGIPVETATDSIGKIAHNDNTYAVGVFQKFQSNLQTNENHLVLLNPSDMGNLGTIMRTMLAFDMKNLAIIRPSADMWDPKVVRASMGAIFQLNFEYFDNIKDYMAKHKNKLYMFTGDADTNLEQAVFTKPYAFVFGNESSGLSEQQAKLGTRIKIPQSDKVDSLNLSIAVGIAMYAAKSK